MAKFILKWKEDVVQYWELEVEAKTSQEVEDMFYEGNHITGDERLDETFFLEADFLQVVKVDETNKKITLDIK